MSSNHSSAPATPPATTARHEQTEAERRASLARARVIEAQAEVEIARARRETKETARPQDHWRRSQPPVEGWVKWAWIFLAFGPLAIEVWYVLATVGTSPTHKQVAQGIVGIIVSIFLCIVCIKKVNGTNTERWPETAMGILIVVLFGSILGAGGYFLEVQFGAFSKTGTAVSGWISSISAPSTTPAPATPAASSSTTSASTPASTTPVRSSSKVASSGKQCPSYCADPAVTSQPAGAICHDTDYCP